GLLRWLEAGLTVPVTYWQTGDPDLPTGNVSKGGLRDLRAQLKATIARQDRNGLLGIAIVPELSLPLGTNNRFLRAGNFVFSPHVVVDRTLDLLFGLRASLAAGVNIRPKAQIGNIEVDDEIFYRLGVGVGLPNFFDRHPEAIAEVSGTTK